MDSRHCDRSRTSRNSRPSVAAMVVGAAGLALAPAALGQVLTTAFTYQGELQNGGVAVDGQYDLRFRLYDAASGGTQWGTTQCVDNVQVVGGRFNVQLDFGSQFAGQQRFLDIQVRADTGLNCANTTGYTLLTPRQSLTATPYASFAPAAGAAVTATNATQLNGQVAGFYQDAGNLTSGTIPEGRMASNVVRTNFSNSFTGTNVFTGFTTFSGAIQSTNPASVYVGDGAGLGGLWRLGGNIGTNPATQFIGTSDNQAITVRVNNRRAGTISPASVNYGPEPAVTSSVSFGADNNFVGAGVAGATICGGGLNPINNPALADVARNMVLANMGTVGGGFGNHVEATAITSFIGGGEYNSTSGVLSAVVGGSTNTASGLKSFIGGGMNNVASADQSTIAGGRNNIVSVYDASIGGGAYNVASGAAATVPGGYLNVAQGASSVAMGSRAQALHDGAFVWSDGTGDFASTGVHQFLIRAGGGVGINTGAPGARLDVRGAAAPGVNVFSGDLAPFGSAGYEANFSAAGIGNNSLIWLGVDGGQRFSVASSGDASASRDIFAGRDLYSGGAVFATGSVQAINGNVFAGTVVTLDQSGANTGRPEVRMTNPGFSDKTGVSAELGGSYAIVNLDNNFRLEGRATDADSGAVRIDGRPSGVQLFQFWSRNPNLAPEVLCASLTETGVFTASGSISAPAKFFYIDHPSDPANKTLRHACVESDEYKNIYDGIVTTGSDGYATVTLPIWMTDLNEKFRYQLTVIDESDSGDPLMWARVVRKVDASNTFSIRTSSGGMEVSWQITGTRKDAWARTNPFTAEEAKVGSDKGKYLSPEAFGKSAREGLNTEEAFEARARTASGKASPRALVAHQN